MTTEEDEENEEPDTPIYRHRLIQQGRRIRMNGKSRAKNKQRNQRWVFKIFEINDQDGMQLWERVAYGH